MFSTSIPAHLPSTNKMQDQEVSTTARRVCMPALSEREGLHHPRPHLMPLLQQTETRPPCPFA